MGICATSQSTVTREFLPKARVRKVVRLSPPGEVSELHAFSAPRTSYDDEEYSQAVTRESHNEPENDRRSFKKENRMNAICVTESKKSVDECVMMSVSDLQRLVSEAADKAIEKA